MTKIVFLIVDPIPSNANFKTNEFRRFVAFLYSLEGNQNSSWFSACISDIYENDKKNETTQD